MNILVKDVPNLLLETDIFIFSISYEQRSLSVFREILESNQKSKIHFYGCFNKNNLHYLTQPLKQAEAAAPHNLSSVELRSDSPRVSFLSLMKMCDSFESQSKEKRIAIDITCFTREALGMLMLIIKRKLNDWELSLIYHKAKSYGLSPNEGWLSRGVEEVRSIVGYSGQTNFVNNTHLILLQGYECERAQEIIDRVQPDLLTLGRVANSESVSMEINRDFEEFSHRIESQYKGIEISYFDFSSVDPYFTRDRILQLVTGDSSNIVLACLNAKPSFVGCCMAALADERIQLVYAQPLAYNTDDYSTQSGQVCFFKGV